MSIYVVFLGLTPQVFMLSPAYADWNEMRFHEYARLGVFCSGSEQKREHQGGEGEGDCGREQTKLTVLFENECLYI